MEKFYRCIISVNKNFGLVTSEYFALKMKFCSFFRLLWYYILVRVCLSGEGVPFRLQILEPPAQAMHGR